jgi:type VI protein secretion system component Hcp
VRLLSFVLAFALLGPATAASVSAAPTPSPLLRSINPIQVNLNGAPAGTTLTLGSHPEVKVLSWSLTSDATANAGSASGGAGAGKITVTPLTVTVPFSSADAFFQTDAINGTHEAQAVLVTPTGKFTLKPVTVTSFSISGSDTSATAQVTLTFVEELVVVTGGGGPVAPCPSSVTDTTVCFPNLNPIVVTTWNMNTTDSSGKSATTVTFAANVGVQGDSLQLLQTRGTTITCVGLLTSSLKYKFQNVKLTSVALQGSGTTSTANVAMSFGSVATGTNATCPTSSSVVK